MNRILLGKVFLVLVCLATVQVCFGQDAAMITVLEGDGVRAAIGSTAWFPSLGETLPVATRIAVASASTLGILHLLNNSAVTIHGEKMFTILKDGFEGIDSTTLKPVERLAAKLDLESKSMEQVGAISADKISFGVSGGKIPKFKSQNLAFPDTFADGNLSKPEPQTEPEHKPLSRSLVPSPAPKPSGSNFDKSDADSRFAEPQPIWLGLPEPFELSPQKDSIPVASWTLFTLDPDESTKEAFFLHGKKGGAKRKIEIGPNPDGLAGLSVLAAMVHESNGEPEQAAGIWLKLASEDKIPQAVLNAHLIRLQAKIADFHTR